MANTVERHGNSANTYSVPFGNHGNAVGIPIAADKYAALFRRKCTQKRIDRIYQLAMVYLLLHIDRARYQIGKLVQNRGQLSTASLIGSIPFVSAKGQISNDFSEKRGQNVGSMRRHSVPCAPISIVDALFCVLTAAQYVFGNSSAVTTVFVGGSRDCLLVSIPIQLNDLGILHLLSPHFPVCPFNSIHNF